MTEPIQYVRTDPDGTMRVGKTRLLLDMVVYAFNDGKSAEAIRHSFPAISLAQAHGAVAFYLENKAFVDEYIARREKEAEVLRREMEAICPPRFTREFLLARLRERKGTVA